jgi:nicotinate-nucleotide pyrophosphorylase (carboxylating)
MQTAWHHPEVINAVERALSEDIGSGDITSRYTVPAGKQAFGRFFARAECVLAGVELLPIIYEMRGGVDRLVLHKESGHRAQPGHVVAEVEGNAHRLLECERVGLNFMQRLSGIATLARRFHDEVKHTRCKVLDTRKTTPGLRRLEKLAAAAGGVTNHRMGLFDAILIKNNHITAAGGVAAALRNAAAADVPVEIEVRTWEELNEALDCGAKRLLLDNLTPEQAREWITHVNGRASCEISGGITLSTVRAYAEAGADFVSSGAITHSATSVDLNFHLQWR